jgi:hypothetical protein
MEKPAPELAVSNDNQNLPLSCSLLECWNVKGCTRQHFFGDDNVLSCLEEAIQFVCEYVPAFWHCLFLFSSYFGLFFALTNSSTWH